MYTNNKVMRSDMIKYYKSVAGEGVVRSSYRDSILNIENLEILVIKFRIFLMVYLKLLFAKLFETIGCIAIIITFLRIHLSISKIMSTIYLNLNFNIIPLTIWQEHLQNEILIVTMARNMSLPNHLSDISFNS